MNRNILLVFILLINCASYSQVVINEINGRGSLLDEQGETSDWIELFNASATDINLDGYYLSDDPLFLKKWSIPATTISSDGYLLFLADGKNLANEVNHWETAIFSDNVLKYFIGSTEPPSDWNTIDFNDATWTSGVGGIGYGDFDDGTVIVNTISVYVRKTFEASDTAALVSAMLSMDYDDAFVAYINGVEIFRSENIFGSPPLYNATASLDHEAQFYLGGTPDGFSISKSELRELLIPGENVLCIQVHNTSAFSSDLSCNAWLSFGIKDGSSFFEPTPIWFPISNGYNHTNFSIHNEGETIYLSNTLGEIIDQKNTEFLENDFAVARIPDGGSWCITNEISPLLTNNIASCFSGYEPDPIFNLAEGFYDGSQTVEISSPSLTSIIHYTTDGSLVTELSPIYSVPFDIDTTTVIGAKCFSTTNKLPSQLLKQIYLLDEPDFDLPVISLSADPGSFFNIDSGIYVFGPSDWDPNYPYFGSNFWEDWKRLAHITYFDEEGIQQFDKQMYISIHGGWSRAMDQRSFRIDFKNELDGDLFYPLFPDDKPGITSFNNFNLRNSGQHVNGGRIQDAWVARLMNKAHSEIDYEAYYPCVVYLNGKYWGLYEIREKADEFFAESNHHADPNNIELHNGWTVIAGVDTAFNHLYNWVMETDEDDASFYNGFAARVDIDNYIDYYITQIYFQNVDFGGVYWNQNNIKFWKEYDPESKWRHILYDMDGALGWFGEYTSTNYIDLVRNPPYTSYNSQIFDKALNNDAFRIYFTNRFADLINTVYQPSFAEPLAYEMKDQIEPEINRQVERWYLPYSYADWEYYIDWMLSYNSSRITPARNHIKSSFALPAIREIELEISPPDAGHIKISTIYPDVFPWSGKYFEENNFAISAIPNPGFTFENWEPNEILIGGSLDQTIEINLTQDETFVANFSGSASEAELIITEINYHDNETTKSGDWIEIFNAGDEKIDLSGMKLSDANKVNYFQFPIGTILLENTYLIVAENLELFKLVYPDILSLFGGFNFSYGNNGDEIILADLNENEIIHMAYLDSLNWPLGADGTGRTLELLNYNEDLNFGDNWFDGCMKGSPGSAYTPCTDNIVFGEINYKSGVDAEAGDWIEIWNSSSENFDLADWKFADNNDTLLFLFPSPTLLSPNERIVVCNDLLAFEERHPDVENIIGPFLFSLNGNGEELRLIDDQGIVQFSVIYRDKLPWPEEADGGGKTLELISESGKMNTAENWFAGCWEGSPGIAYDSDCLPDEIIELPIIQIQVYPNPTSSDIFIQSNYTETIWFEIHNISGEIIYANILNNTVTYSFKNNPAGIYLVKFFDENAMYFQSEKIVKF